MRAGGHDDTVTGGRSGDSPTPEAPSTTSARLDLRLAAAAGGAWAAAWWALGHGPRAAFSVAGCCAVVAAVAWRVDGRRRARVTSDGQVGLALVAALLAIGAAAGATCTGLRLLERDAGVLADPAVRRAAVTVDLTVTGDPRQVRGSRFGRPIWVVPARVSRVEEGGRAVEGAGRMLVLAADSRWQTLLPGQRLRAEGRLGSPRGRDLTAAVLHARGVPQLRGEPPWVQRAAGSLRAGLQRACADLPPEPGGLLPGLVVGDTSRMDPEVEEAFRATGMTHLTAVSGANLMIVAGMVLFLARWCRVGPWPAAVLAGTAMVGFVVLARPSPSVLRAAVMCGLGLLALALGRPRAAVPALAASAFVLVLVDPALAAAPGFALSVCATAGLLLVAPVWAAGLRRRGVPGGLAEALAVPAAAQAACAPLLAAMTGSVSLTAVPANLLAVPAVAPATVLGVLAAVVSPVSPPLAELLAWAGSWPARWLVGVARGGAGVPGGLLPWPGGAAGGWLLAASLVGLGVLGRWHWPRRVVLAAAMAVVVVALPVRLVSPGWPPPGWITVGCDVGQGDAVVLRSGPGSAVLVDAGPEPAPVDGCLRRLGIRHLSLVVLSHLHVDHVGGLTGAVRGRSVAALGLGPYREPVTGRRIVGDLAEAARLPVVALQPGATYRAGAVTVTVLGPTTAFRGTRSDPNNNSVVLRATVGGVSVLLAGDVEEAAQRALLDAGVPLRADVLKVAHHGSAYSTADFLDAVGARVAVVQVGAGNDYGHPNPGVLAHLHRAGTRVLRTDHHGDVAILRDAHGLATAVAGPTTRPG